MRAWVYDQITGSSALQGLLGVSEAELQARVMPRQSQETVPTIRPFIVYGLGNETSETLNDDTAKHNSEAERQFFQIWIHDEGGDYGLIDDAVEIVKSIFRGSKSPENNITVVLYLETSQEFGNETYNTIFRYIRFQAIKTKEVVLT